MTDRLRTPDFDAYRCDHTVVGVELVSATTLKLTWSDGRVDRHHPWTLRENATDPGTTAAVTRERLTDIATWGDDIALASIALTGDGLAITWAPDGLVAHYDLGWLRNLGGHDWHPRAIRPIVKTWDATAGDPPSFDGPGYLTDDGVLADALGTLGVHGLIRLRRLPDGRDTVLDVGRRIGVVRPTHFGPDFDVVDRHRRDHVAEAADRLGGSPTVIADVDGGADFPPLIESVGRGGRYVTAGAIAGPIVELDLRTLYLRNLEFYGSTTYRRDTFPALLDVLAAGGLAPVVHRRWPLDQIAQAQTEFLAKRHVGSMVLVPPPPEKP